MQIKILGCSGGIGGDLRTTSMLIDHDILIDAGTGVGDLSMEQLLAIDHIFITHSHLDHIACIPLLIDTVMGFREKPVTIHASKDTLATLRAHVFNWKVWPDFNMIPDITKPFMLYEEVALGESITILGRTITPLPANHVVSAIGYHIDNGKNSFVFTGDTTTCDELWDKVNLIDNLKYIVIETAFSNSELELAKLSKHLCPSMLVEELNKLNLSKYQSKLEVFITHLKPGEGETIMEEIAESNLPIPLHALRNHQIFNL